MSARRRSNFDFNSAEVDVCVAGAALSGNTARSIAAIKNLESRIKNSFTRATIRVVEVMARILRVRCKISSRRVLSANSPTGCSPEEHLSRPTPPRPAGRPRSRPPASELILQPALNSYFLILNCSAGDLQCHRSHVVIGRRIGAELLDGRKDRVDDLAGRARSGVRHDVQQPLGPELAAERVVCL